MSSVTIHDIARRAKLNSSTVSRALRGNPCVREATRRLIRQIADELGYVPDLNARNLADGRTRRVAFLMNSLYNEIERDPASLVNRLLDESGYSMMILLSSGSKEIFLQRLDQLAQKLCDGALIIPSGGLNEPDVLRKLESLRCPVVFIDRWPAKSSFPAVTTDHAEAMRRLFECAVQEGFDASFVHLPKSNSASVARRKGLLSLLKERKEPFFCEKSDLREWLKQNPCRKLCIFANGFPEPSFYNDVFTDGVVRPPAFFACGFDRVQPEAVIYYDRMYICIQDFQSIGRSAAAMLTALLEGKPLEQRLCQIPPLEIRKIGG